MKSLLFRSLRRVLAPLPVRWFVKVPGAPLLYTAIYRRLKPHGVQEVECQGHRMVVNAHDEGVARQILVKGIYEEEETHFFLEWLKPNMAVIDIGANVGYFTLLACKAVGPGGTVFAFEPEPGNFKLLEKNLSLNAYAQGRPLQLALSDKRGTVRLFTDSANLGNPSLARGNITSSADAVDVETARLDDLLAEQKDLPARFDLIKMDAQGAEALVIEGAVELLKRDRPTLLIEFWPMGLENMGSDPTAFLERLQGLGYSIRHVSRHGGTGAPLRPADVVRDCKARHRGTGFVNLIFEPLSAS